MKCTMCEKRKAMVSDGEVSLCAECEKEFKHDMINTALALITMILLISFLGDAKW